MFGFYLRDNTRVLPSCYPRDTIMNREARARKTESPTNLDQVAMAIMMRAATQHSRTNSPTWSVTLGAAIPTEPTHRATTTYPWAKSRRRPGPLQVDIVNVWTVQRVHRSGHVTVTDGKRLVKLPPEYVKSHTHLAYASTEFGVQGATVQAGHGIVTDSSSASAVYVSATRGRESNTLHLVAETRLQARELFVDAMTREVGDRGLEKKRGGAERDLEGMTGTRTHTESQRTQAAWWGVDVDRPTTRPAASARNAQRDPERDPDLAREKLSTRTTEATARTSRDSEATQIARDADKTRRRTRDRGVER